MGRWHTIPASQPSSMRRTVPFPHPSHRPGVPLGSFIVWGLLCFFVVVLGVFFWLFFGLKYIYNNNNNNIQNVTFCILFLSFSISCPLLFVALFSPLPLSYLLLGSSTGDVTAVEWLRRGFAPSSARRQSPPGTEWPQNVSGASRSYSRDNHGRTRDRGIPR